MKILLGKRLISLVIILFVSASSFVCAQTKKPEITITPLTWKDQQDLNNKAVAINEIVRSKLGSEIHQNKDDIVSLQRIIDSKFIDKSDKDKWQATGVVIGNLLIAELKELKWMVYEDKQGRSRAVCVPKTDQCLFPTTMISRRVEAHAPISVQAIYDNAYALIKPQVDAVNPYQPSQLVRPKYELPPEAPRDESKRINVKFK